MKNSSSFVADEDYQPIYALKTADGSKSVPNIVLSGKRFAGLFTKDGTRVKQITKEIIDGNDYLTVKFINYADAGLIALVCIIIVFAMLILIWGVVSLFRFFPKKKTIEKVQTNKTQVIEPKKVFTMADIKDDDMMAAALVATIDYHNETDENVRVVSVKQIG